MAQEFYTIITQAGQEKLMNATTGQKLEFHQFAVGDGNGRYYEPTASQYALVNEKYRATTNTITIEENKITIECLIPAHIGGFTIREIGIFDKQGTLILVGKYPQTEKPVAESGSEKDLYIKVMLELDNAENIAITADPNVVIATMGNVKKELKKYYTKDEVDGRFEGIHKVEIVNHLESLDKDKALSAAQGKALNENKLGKREKAADSDKLDGHDSTYFATQSGVQTAQETANQGVNAATAAQTAATQGVNAAAAAHSRANEAYDRAEQAFQSASNGKITIANAITGKGVPTSTTASWSEMAGNIGKIKTFKFKRTNINSITLDFNYTHSAELQYTFEKDSILVYQRMKGAYYTSDRIEISIYPTVNPWYDFGLDEGRDNRTICVVPAGTYTIRGYSGSTRWSSVSIPFEIFE